MSTSDGPGPGSAPAAPAPGTSANTLCAWLIVALPALTLVPSIAYVIRIHTVLDELFEHLSAVGGRLDPSQMIALEMSLILDPWYLVLVVLGWGSWGLYAWFSYRDVRELERRGFPRPFAWPWVFLSPLVYIVGRHVVLRRSGGSGAAPLAATVSVQAVSALLAGGWAVWFVFDVLRSVLQAVSSY